MSDPRHVEIRDASLSVAQFHFGPLSVGVQRGEHVCVIGPSGAGKSLLLELVAGFRQPRQGSLFLRGVAMADTPPQTRGCAWVPQHHSLFPHLSVRDNIAYGLRARHLPAPECDERVGSMAERLGIVKHLDARPAGLSGGERQRVALARALVTRADLLLLDEPFSSVEPGLRAKMWELVLELQRELGLTVVHVTHDVRKAVSNGRVLVMHEGRLVHDGPAGTTDARAWLTQLGLSKD